MNEQLPPIVEVAPTPSGVSSSVTSDLEQKRKISIPIPWSVYFVTYFIQGSIMPMILIYLSVYLRQCLGLDWLTVTAIFIVIITPVFLRPAFAIITDRRPTKSSPMFVIGAFLVATGSALAGLSALERTSGLLPFTIGFAGGAAGATILNVVMDSYIIRAIPLDKSARINSHKKIFSFLGGAVIPIAYIFFVGSNLSNSSAWAIFFSLPAIIAVIIIVLLFAKKKIWTIIPIVTGLPPLRAQWLTNRPIDSNNPRAKIIPIVLLASIIFLFFFPDGLFETPWENFIVDSYGEEAWAVYNGAIILFGIVSIIGFLLARRSGKHVPEWDLLWYTPLMLGYYVMILLNPPFPVVLWVSLGFQIPSAFIQVRIFQSMQSHSYFKKAGLTFQVFMVTLQGGKFVGIGMSGVIMTNGGYTSVFMASIASILIMFFFIIVYWTITGSSRLHPTQNKTR